MWGLAVARGELAFATGFIEAPRREPGGLRATCHRVIHAGVWRVQEPASAALEREFGVRGGKTGVGARWSSETAKRRSGRRSPRQRHEPQNGHAATGIRRCSGNEFAGSAFLRVWAAGFLRVADWACWWCLGGRVFTGRGLGVLVVFGRPGFYGSRIGRVGGGRVVAFGSGMAQRPAVPPARAGGLLFLVNACILLGCDVRASLPLSRLRIS